MSKSVRSRSSSKKAPVKAESPLRADAQRNAEALVEAAKKVFAKLGCDAPVREIADAAGVGVGTVYRRYPKRSDLIAAVFRREVDACATAATTLAEQHSPGEAVRRWVDRFVDFINTKRGLASALHSGDPAYTPLRAYFDENLVPALDDLLKAAVEAGEIEASVEARELIMAVASLCTPRAELSADYPRRMIGLLLDGLRCRGDRT